MSSYDYDLTSKIPKALDREQNEQFYARVMAGDDKAREEMIEGNMPLVIAKVDAYIGCHPQVAYLRDDLHSAGFLALVKAVNTMAEHDQPSNVNPTGYISVAITHEIIRVIEKESAMGLTSIPESEEGPVSDRDVPQVGHDIPARKRQRSVEACGERHNLFREGRGEQSLRGYRCDLETPGDGGSDEARHCEQKRQLPGFHRTTPFPGQGRDQC